jgi:hypothetical protein
VLLAAIPATPVYAFMVFGLVIAIVGHLAGDRRVVAIGIALLFAATGLLFLGAYLEYDSTGPTQLGR